MALQWTPSGSRRTDAVIPTIDVHLEPDWWQEALRTDVAEGLAAVPRSIPPKWFYDELGSQLFDQITRLDEYYPFRAEREILDERSAEIVAVAGADTLVELGSGTSEKSRLFLDAMQAAGQLRRYVPFDVSEEMLRLAANEVATAYPAVEVHGVVGDFERHIPEVPIGGTGMVAFLGSTIGNFEPKARATFIRNVCSALNPGGTFLVGTDLVKEPARLWAAYNDSQGVTARFNLNVLEVVNRELAANFDVEQFEHVADWDPEHEWVDIGVRSRCDQTVVIEALDGLSVDFVEGEFMRTEVSSKFRPGGIIAELAAAGLDTVGQWTDAAGDYALTLAERR